MLTISYVYSLDPSPWWIILLTSLLQRIPIVWLCNHWYCKTKQNKKIHSKNHINNVRIQQNRYIWSKSTLKICIVGDLMMLYVILKLLLLLLLLGFFFQEAYRSVISRTWVYSFCARPSQDLNSQRLGCNTIRHQKAEQTVDMIKCVLAVTTWQQHINHIILEIELRLITI